MIRVALIIERADIALGGAERSIAELAEALRACGLSCTIVAATGDPDEGLCILCPERGGSRTPLDLFRRMVRVHLAETQYDVVHSTLPLPFADIYQPRGGSYRAAMRGSAEAYERPWQIAAKRCANAFNARRRTLLAAERTLCRDTGVTIAALSHLVKGHFQADYGLADDRIAVIPNGIRVTPPPTDEQAAAFRQRLGPAATGGAPILLFAANNLRLKGLGPLLRAWARIPADARRRGVLAIVGSGRAGPYRRLAHRLGIADRVVFAGPVDAIGPALAACRAAVLPTWYDPCSRFILEALAAGRPVVTTRFNGAAERFVDGRHGRILDRPNDIDGLAAALTHMLDDGWAERARRAIIEDNLPDAVSIEHHVEALIGLYGRLPAERKEAHA